MIRHLLLCLLLAASAWAETYEEMKQQTDMTNADAVFALAEWCAENRMPTQAGRLYSTVIKIDPDHYGARTARGEVLVGDRWVNKAFAPTVSGQSSDGAGSATGGGRRSSGGPGPTAKDVAWDLSLPKDPNPVQNDFVDGLIERMRTADNESTPMAAAIATLIRDDNWPTAFPRLCAALLKPGYGDVYGASDLMLELYRMKRLREMRRLYPFIVKASEGVDDPRDLLHFAMMSQLMRERKAIPRLIELLSHQDTDVQSQVRETLAAITRLPENGLTAEKAKAWWDANWSASEDEVLMEQLKGGDPDAAVEAAAGLVEMRNAEIFPVIFKLMRNQDPGVVRRAVDVLRRATTLDWGISAADPADQREDRIKLAEKWWSEEKTRFRWPGIPDTEDETPAGAASATNPDREAVNSLSSTTGTVAQDAEARLRARGREVVPALIDGLSSPNPLVRRRAHDILQQTTRQNFQFDPRDDEAKRLEAIAAWRAWAVAEKLIVDEDAQQPPDAAE